MSHTLETSPPIAPGEPILVTRGVLQPFQCDVCYKRFTRHENLKRHLGTHRPTDTIKCAHCSSTFSRPDLRRRHVNKKHPEHSDRPVRRREMSTTVDERSATDSPPRQGMEFSLPVQDNDEVAIFFDYDASQRMFEQDAQGMSMDLPGSSIAISHRSAGSTSTVIEPFSASLQSTVTLPSPDLLILDPSQRARGLTLFQQHALAFIPFFHPPTFDPTAYPDLLTYSMLCIGLNYSSDPTESGPLASKCFHHAMYLLETQNHRGWPVPLVQALCLMHLYAVMYACGDDTVHGLRIRNKAIEVIRREGMMDPLPSRSDATTDLDAMWKQFIRSEEHKRTLFFFYHLDTTIYILLSTPRTVSHLEIKHDLPCAEDMWLAPSATVWAHRRLLPCPAGSGTIRYISAVHAAVSTTQRHIPLASPFAYDILLLFFYAAVREVSGWSTMTGKIGFERFEVLNHGLMALETSVCHAHSDDPWSIDAEATWRSTMLELLLWNPTHTSGLVELSLNASVVSAVILSAAQSEIFTPQRAEMLDPHVIWFLSFLDRTQENPPEAPWVTMYAFKVVLIAWQLALAGNLGSLRQLGLNDSKEFAQWARKVFSRRTQSGAGRLICASLASLESQSEVDLRA